MKKIFPDLITVVVFTLFSILVVGTFEYKYYNASDKLYFVVDMEVSSNGSSQVFFDVGVGFNEEDSYKINNKNTQKYSFPLPVNGIKSIRFDPTNNNAVVRIKYARIENKQGDIIKNFTPHDFRPINQIAKMYTKDGLLFIHTVENAVDPIIIMENFNTETQFIWSDFIQKRIWIILGYSLLFFIFLVGLNYLFVRKLERYRAEVKRILNGVVHNVINSDEKYLWGLFALFSALYFFTYINANNYLITAASHDDALFFWLGQNIANGNWLGEYMQLTLAKMPSYAMFIAFSIKTGIPYLWLFSFCHIIAVSFLLIKSKYLFNNAKLLLFIMGILLLFSPILATHLRIYRFQLPAICFIVFIASIISMFNPSSKKSHWVVKTIDAFIVSIAWGLLWFSREEYLFYVGCIFVALIAFFLVKKFISTPLRNMYPLIYGLVGVVVFWLFISSMNYKHYGRFVVCEKTSSPYTSVIKTFNSIADPDFPQNISGSAASREKILAVAEEVPMFKPMSDNLIASASTWRGVYFDKNKLAFATIPKNMLTVSHFEWAWISASEASGYYKDATTLAKFYSEFDTQMKKAIRDGRLSTKSGNLVQVGPYSLSQTDIDAIIKLLPKNYYKLFPKPKNVALTNQNLLVKKSPIGNKAIMKIWGESLKINYITEGNTQAYQKNIDSVSNKIWNTIVIIWAYTAMPLIHLATLLAFIALVISIIRKQWVSVAIIVIVSSIYIAHYLMLTTVSVISSYDAVNSAYFLPSYATALINAFLSLSIILNTLKPNHEK